jgi:hypothetical protein
MARSTRLAVFSCPAAFGGTGVTRLPMAPHDMDAAAANADHPASRSSASFESYRRDHQCAVASASAGPVEMRE